jgi:hypothetical protein
MTWGSERKIVNCFQILHELKIIINVMHFLQNIYFNNTNRSFAHSLNFCIKYLALGHKTEDSYSGVRSGHRLTCKTNNHMSLPSIRVIFKLIFSSNLNFWWLEKNCSKLFPQLFVTLPVLIVILLYVGFYLFIQFWNKAFSNH